MHAFIHKYIYNYLKATSRTVLHFHLKLFLLKLLFSFLFIFIMRFLFIFTSVFSSPFFFFFTVSWREPRDQHKDPPAGLPRCRTTDPIENVGFTSAWSRNVTQRSKSQSAWSRSSSQTIFYIDSSTLYRYSTRPLYTKLVKLLHTSLFLHLPLYSSIWGCHSLPFHLGLSPLLQLFLFFFNSFCSIYVNSWNISLESWLCHHFQSPNKDMCANTHTHAISAPIVSLPRSQTPASALAHV